MLKACRMPGLRVRQAGVGLIELLVAIVIATLGLLSLAGMQVFSARHARLSQFRAVATHLSQDLGERMRANSHTAYTYSQTFAEQAGSYAPDPAAPPAPRCNAVSDTCSASQMAAADLYEWRLDVRQLLPQGSVIVQPDATGNAHGVDLWVAWLDPRGRSAGSERGARECSSALALASDSTARCLYFRVRP